MEDCLACELLDGRRTLPGGPIEETAHWAVEHCVGPLGVGTLIVKPRRHLLHVWDLEEDEARELGPLLRRVSAAQRELLEPEQLYVTLWSHSGGSPVHIHWVLQPIQAERPRPELLGPYLQAAMFDAGELPPTEQVERFADEMRALLNHGGAV
ncbi:MAG TPA: hypothetical protein VH025_03775 [Solirubrobacteraceae bacterium]|nr:hypothetical protein [Solirubrobacteraceae bacterium]